MRTSILHGINEPNTHFHSKHLCDLHLNAKLLKGMHTVFWQSSSTIDRNRQMSLCMSKPTKWPVHPAKTQISLGIRPVWSEFSLSAWRSIGTLATHREHSEDWSVWADAQADQSLRWAHKSFCWFCHAQAKMQMHRQLCIVVVTLTFALDYRY